MMKRIVKIGLCLVIAIFLIAVSLLVVCNTVIVNNAKGKLYSNVDSIPRSEVGLLLGTTPQTRIGGWTNYFFKYRIDAAEALYKSGKVEYLLISGDENSLDGINEVECMRDSLVKRGIPESDIILDGKGFRTLDAVVRAVKLYHVHSFVVISQKFHNERAVYLAEHLGLDVHDIMGFNAKSPKTKMALMTYIREYFARVKVFLDIFMGKQPKIVGEDYPDCPWNVLYINSVKAHNEQDTIIGNFTGQGLDTLYVEDVSTYNNEEGLQSKFFMTSPNKKIPKVELYGCSWATPKLVNEGDLDGNGTCEVGYLHTWVTSQWRYYRIFSLVGNEWRYLINGDFLDTSLDFRGMRVDIAKPGPQKGLVLIHYLYYGYDEIKDKRFKEVRDTIVAPTFDMIDD